MKTEITTGFIAQNSFRTRSYSAFIGELKHVLLDPSDDGAIPFLDGLAGSRCLELLPRKSICGLGTYFTPSHIAERLIDQLEVEVWEDEVFLDPSCGAGDLLLPIARQLPLEITVSSTLRIWNTRLFGCDLSSEFIEAARLRLVLLAAHRGASMDGEPSDLACLLTNVFVANGLSVSGVYERSTCIVMNPPYGRVLSNGQPWRSGSVSCAALFLERGAKLSAPGTRISALLPEVLRTGSSYSKWRSYIDELVSHSEPRSIGVFSNRADVDVFLQCFKKREIEAPAEPAEPQKRGATIGHYFDVLVGAVVPHRHAPVGKKYAYLHARNATPWAEIRRIDEARRFEGRVFSPPFVVVRRTSRPGDPFRAVATLILGKREVAVENHLIVFIPKKGSVRLCRELVVKLRSPSTRTLLDRTMRCRHLTVGSVSSMPWT